MNTDERLAKMEERVENLVNQVVEVKTAVQHEGEELKTAVANLHGKWDDFSQNILRNYVSIDTFNEYKRGQEEKAKNNRLEKIIYILVTAVITGLIAFFFRELKI